MPAKKLGTFVINGVTFVYDGFTKDGHSWPIIICPQCGNKRRVGANRMSSLESNKSTGCCRSCAAKARWEKRDDEYCENGVVIYWSERTEDHHVPLRYACNHHGKVLRADRNAFNLRKKKAGHCPSCAAKAAALSGPSSPRWQGGQFVDSQGYVMLLVNNLTEEEQVLAEPMQNHAGYIAEHRLIMAKTLGHSLEKKESVHHLNGIKGDNRPENLITVTRHSHGKANATTIKQLHTEIKRLQELLDKLGIGY